MLCALPLGLDDDSIALIWTCVERREPEAEAAPFWASLPQRFATRERRWCTQGWHTGSPVPLVPPRAWRALLVHVFQGHWLKVCCGEVVAPWIFA